MLVLNSVLKITEETVFQVKFIIRYEIFKINIIFCFVLQSQDSQKQKIKNKVK